MSKNQKVSKWTTKGSPLTKRDRMSITAASTGLIPAHTEFDVVGDPQRDGDNIYLLTKDGSYVIQKYGSAPESASRVSAEPKVVQPDPESATPDGEVTAPEPADAHIEPAEAEAEAKVEKKKQNSKK